MSRILFPVILISAFAALAFGQAAVPVWSDEFDGKAGSPPDASKWMFMKGGEGWGNRELQYYTESRDNVRHDGKGNLVIEAREADPKAGLKCWYGPCRYTSARLSTKGLFSRKYGRFEARMRLPEGQGVWPAFWLLGDNIDKAGWPACGEIDIMEMIGREPSTLYGTIHGPGYSGAEGPGKNTKLKNGKFSDGFNVFAVEWRPERIDWYLNGRLYSSKTPSDLPKDANWAFDHTFFVILNLAIGGNWPGDPDGSTSFPARVEVDYVRVYDLGSH
jgi:beta-glucanase (GH16 family)